MDAAALVAVAAGGAVLGVAEAVEPDECGGGGGGAPPPGIDGFDNMIGGDIIVWPPEPTAVEIATGAIAVAVAVVVVVKVGVTGAVGVTSAI
jgi:hypothetical protein